jgi:cytochrome P450
VQELVRDFEAVVQERRAGRKPELLQLLLNIAEAEPGITREDVYAQCVLLLLAGHETTRNLIGNGILTLLRHPQALEELRQDPTAISEAVEEILRFESPVQAFGATHLPLESKERVLADCSVIVFIGAASRPRTAETDDSISTEPDRHMAFGAAPALPGRYSGATQAQVATALIRRFPRLQLAEPTPDWGPGELCFQGAPSSPAQVTVG